MKKKKDKQTKDKQEIKVIRDTKDLLNETKERIRKYFTPANITTMLVALGVSVVAMLSTRLGWADALIEPLGSWVINLLYSIATIAISVFFSKALDMVLVLVLRGSAKAVTIERMIHSFIKYVIAIIAIIIILVIWFGQEYIAGVLGGVGIMTLVIGFGAQKLIGDVIAGIFMVFEGYIAVGDIVTINDWRGTVKEIGVRSTVLVSDGGDVKVFTNSVITEFINLSRNASVAVVTTYIDYAIPVEQAEQVIRAALPAIKAAIPDLLETPDYKGIEEMGDNGYLVKVIGKCPENKRFQVTRDLTRELMLALQVGGVTIAYPQIDVHTRQD